MRHARIVGTGLYVPPNKYTNDDIARIMGQPVPDSVPEKLGIKERYFTGLEMSSADLGLYAAEVAIVDASLTPEEIDLIIVCSDTPEYISPATSMVIQGRLKAVNAGVFDLAASCAGFATGCEVASQMIAAGPKYSNVLVIGIYNMTKYVDMKDPRQAPIFADGGGAAILQATDDDSAGFMSSKLYADGTQYDFLGIYAGGTKYPVNRNRSPKIEFPEQLLTFLQPLPPARNIELWPQFVREMLGEIGLFPDDVQHYIFSQINRFVIMEVLRILGQPEDKAICIMDRFGYTGSACIPMALDVARREGRIKTGDYVVMVGSGSGLAVAGTVFKF